MFLTRSILARITLTAAICLALNHGSIAQQTQPAPSPDAPPDAPTPAPQSQSAPAQSAPNMANPVQGSVAIFEVLQKKSVVFPDLATTQGPLSPWDKFKLAANNSVSVSTISAAVVGAAFSLGIDSPDGWGQDWAGYGQRLGANVARETSGNLFGNFLLASALHEDPRFYVQKNLSFGESVKYAAQRLVITRSDSGEQVVNYSGLIGPLMAEGLANAYYPDQNRTAGHTFTRYASDMGWRFAGNMLRQYWPRINHRIGLTEESNAVAKP